ncbi:MAG: histidine kinase [Chloroflexota bacterium]|nr:histidine kinase [Chloroflexota bacterium]
MFDRPSDRVAAMIALAAVSLGLLATVSRSPVWWNWLFLPAAVAMLIVGAWWLGRQNPGTPFHDMALPAAVATVTPMLAEMFREFQAYQADVIALPWILTAAGAATLGIRLADTLPVPYRLPTTLAVAALATGGAALGILLPPLIDSPGSSQVLAVIATLSLAATTAVPGLVAGAVSHGSGSIDRERASVASSLELGVLGLTPAIAVLTMTNSFGSPRAAIPLVAWILVVLAVQYLAVRPLSRRASLATTQRDVVVAAMEAERSRIAADIHDDALQELTLLGWRLDAAGDRQGAASAREVADRLRAICGDLRLPILDDLGTGPALEWLVERVARLAGGEVRLERTDQVRPPPEVELAFFRVAQEALSNAVRHGRPPIVVRYWTSASGASLSIADSGAGFDPTRMGDVGEGHFGLLNMRQRAEQIGALLDVRRWPSGGTQVALEWRAQ